MLILCWLLNNWPIFTVISPFTYLRVGGACVTGQYSLLVSHKQGNKTQVKIYDFYTNLSYSHIYTEFQLSTFWNKFYGLASQIWSVCLIFYTYAFSSTGTFRYLFVTSLPHFPFVWKYLWAPLLYCQALIWLERMFFKIKITSLFSLFSLQHFSVSTGHIFWFTPYSYRSCKKFHSMYTIPSFDTLKLPHRKSNFTNIHVQEIAILTFLQSFENSLFWCSFNRPKNHYFDVLSIIQKITILLFFQSFKTIIILIFFHIQKITFLASFQSLQKDHSTAFLSMLRQKITISWFL